MNTILPIRLLNSKTSSVTPILSVIFGIFFLFATIPNAYTQSLSGQWIGGFSSANNVSTNKTDFVLELEVNGAEVTGYSYTYFAMAGKRYFVICKLKGTYDKGSKSLKVVEVENLKSNTQPDFQNCLQSHQLTYFKKNDKEILIGKWSPSEKGSTCGNGNTEVERKTIAGITVQNPSTSKNQVSKKPSNIQENAETARTTLPKAPEPKESNAKTQDTLTNKIQSNQSGITLIKPNQENTVDNHQDQKKFGTPALPIDGGKARPLTEQELSKLSKRDLQVIQTIEFTGTTIKIEIYDNGQVDGDIISLYLNEKLLLPSQMLTAQPITININVKDNEDKYDLIMYAESMGKIPPNTALMIVTTATNRHEINITSTELSSGVVRFKQKR